MVDTTNAELWLNETSDGRRFAAAIALSIVIEFAALCALLPWLSHPPRNPSDHPSPIKISIIAPAPPRPPAPKPVLPPPPKPVAPPPPLPVAPPMPLPPPVPVPAPHRVFHRPVPPRHVITPPVVPPPVVQPPTAPAPAPPPAPSAGELDIFQAEMRRAVQEAATNITPEAAEMAHEVGVVRISFSYADGAVSNITIIASSGFPLLDKAAIEAAQIAHYPPQPPDFAGRTDNIVVDVIFREQATDVDSD